MSKRLFLINIVTNIHTFQIVSESYPTGRFIGMDLFRISGISVWMSRFTFQIAWRHYNPEADLMQGKLL